MGPTDTSNTTTDAISQDLMAAIKDSFGSVEEMKSNMTQTAADRCAAIGLEA